MCPRNWQVISTLPIDIASISQGHAESKSTFSQCVRTDRLLHPQSGFAISSQPIIDRGWQSRTADAERLAWVLIHSGESTIVGLPVGFVRASQSSVNREEAKSSTPTGSRLVAQGRPRSGRPWVDLDNLQPQRGCVPHLTQPRWGWNWRNRSSTQGFPRCGQPWATRRDPFGVSSRTIEMHIPAASARSVMISVPRPPTDPTGSTPAPASPSGTGPADSVRLRSRRPFARPVRQSRHSWGRPPGHRPRAGSLHSAT